jgi:hypothetical protein
MNEEFAMPFDGSATEMPRIAIDKIDRIVALLHSRDRWCQGAMEREGGTRCIVGAMRAVHAELLLERPILHAIRQVTGRDYRRIESFNDSEATTHAVVLRVLAAARETLGKGADTSDRLRLGC